MCANYFDSVVPENHEPEKPELELQKKWKSTQKISKVFFEEFQFSLGLEQVSGFIRAINKYADERTPWKLAKSDQKEDKLALRTCLGSMVESLRLASVILAPVMPDVHARIHERLGLKPVSLWSKELEWGKQLETKQIKEKIILFPP